MNAEMQVLQTQFIMQGCKEAGLRFAAEDQGVADLVSRIRPIGQVMGTVDLALVELVKDEVKTMGHGLFYGKNGARERLCSPEKGFQPHNVGWAENRFDWVPTKTETEELLRLVRKGLCA